MREAASEVEDGQKEVREAVDLWRLDVLLISSASGGVSGETGSRGRKLSGKSPEIVGSPVLDSKDSGDPEGVISSEVWTLSRPADPGLNTGDTVPHRGDAGGGLASAGGQRDSGDVAPLGSTTGKL